jgi:hypothetical protein
MACETIAIWWLLLKRNKDQKSCNTSHQFNTRASLYYSRDFIKGTDRQTDQTYFVFVATKVETILSYDALMHVSLTRVQHFQKLKRS